MGSNTKSLIVLLIFSAIAGGGYLALTKFDVFGSAMVRAKDVEEKTAELEKTILGQLDQLSRITFSPDLFEREDFASLKDHSTALPQPRVSRPNPFAELP
jgi:hypothetical protein